ncbi:unnamed protein product, partial [Dovyalis caffra]
ARARLRRWLVGTNVGWPRHRLVGARKARTLASVHAAEAYRPWCATWGEARTLGWCTLTLTKLCAGVRDVAACVCG